MSAIGTAYLVINFVADMNRADGTQLKVQILFNGFKPVVIKCFEPTALSCCIIRE
jgi:hypothetical protein